TFNAVFHTLTVTSGAASVTLDALTSPAGTRFAALGDHAGGTEVRLAIIGNAANDLIDATHHPVGQSSPGAGPDVTLGLAGSDTLKGLVGDDILVGGTGKDMLVGGPGADRFVFQSLADSSVAAPDTVFDFKTVQHDKVDLYDIDADTTHAGNQAF